MGTLRSIGALHETANSNPDSEDYGGQHGRALAKSQLPGPLTVGCSLCAQPFSPWEKIVYWEALGAGEFMRDGARRSSAVYFHGECAVEFADNLITDARKTESGKAYLGDYIDPAKRWADRKQRRIERTVSNV